MKNGPGSGIAANEVPGGPLLVEREPDPCTLVIFGATGDLTRRKLIPALYSLGLERRLPEPLVVLGVGREAMPATELRARLREATADLARQRPLDPAAWDRLRIDYVGGDLEAASSYAELARRLGAIERSQGTRGNRAYYLAVPPSLSPVIVEQLHRAGLLYEHAGAGRPWTRVVVEKPFGRDLASAEALNALLARYLDESQIFRIDHYLGKETVQNLLIFRFGNAIFEPLWNRGHIDHVQITAAESIGVEGRGRFYDATGVLRDVVQSHLLLVLAMAACEPPTSFAADDIRNASLQVLRSLAPLTAARTARDVVRAQYRGYQREEGVSPGSRTPTFMAMKTSLESWRWQGVPFYVRAGKRLRTRMTEVAVQFQPIPLCLFQPLRAGCQSIEPNVLSLRIQPDEGIDLRFVAKVPGDHLSVGNVLMSMRYASAFGRPIPEAYERLLLDVMRGDQTLFARRDVVEAAWRFVTPILEAWEADTTGPVPLYEPGSTGPREADDLLERDGRKWRPLE
jgi:glucose-6-phosphate 1-dehydrogenase